MKVLCTYCNQEIETEEQNHSFIVFPNNEPEQFVIRAHFPDCLAMLVKDIAADPPTSLTDIALARTEAILAKRRARKSAGG